MATGGSGDLLAGLIGSLVAQGIDCFKGAVAGVYIHGALGDEISAKYSMMGNTPSLMLNEMPAFLNKFE
jgi:NAD(P)H-hydrate epimerase